MEGGGRGDRLVLVCFCPFLTGVRLLYCPYLLLRTLDPGTRRLNFSSVGAGADAQGTGRSKSQTDKTPSVYSPTAVRGRLLVQATAIHSHRDHMKTVTPLLLVPLPSHHTSSHFFFPPFSIYVLLRLILGKRARERLESN